MTPINCDRDMATAAREGLQRMGPIIAEGQMKVNTIIQRTKRVSPKRIGAHLFPIPAQKSVAAYLGDLGRLSRDP
jgi:hypothetical protein